MIGEVQKLDTELKHFLITEKLNIVDCLERLDVTAKGILFVTDSDNKLVGCLTDGDIRRWILKNGNLDGNAGLFMHRDPKYLYENNRSSAKKLMEGHRISSLPIVDSEMHIIDILFDVRSDSGEQGKISSKVLCNTDVIIMAGGKGTRLFPYTKILPKPLIPIGDIPILERIMERFYSFGADRFYLTVNYKKEMIRSYFHEIVKPYRIVFVEETLPLGTAGSIRLIDKKFDNPVIVTNCDILIDADYGQVLGHHLTSGNDMTIVSSLKNTIIQYGVLHTKEQGIVTSMEEKPHLSNFINTGMYIINPEYLNWIPNNEVFHMTQLAQMMIEKGKKVGMYPISENSFLDMGQFEEMKKMEEKINLEAK